jgi:uracil phosphoribosyltransferase
VEKLWKKVFENVAGKRKKSFFRINVFRYFRSIRIGKILINEGHVIYAKLPADVHRRRILVTYPVITTGSTVLTGLQVLLKEYQCIQSHIILITLFSTPEAIKQICQCYPEIKIVVSEINKIAPNHFAQKYFGKNIFSHFFLIFLFFF